MQPLQQFAKTTGVYSREAQGQADGTGQRSEGPDSIISSSDLSSAVTMRIDKRASSLHGSVGSPLLDPRTAPCQYAPEETKFHGSCLTRKYTKALSTENRDEEEVLGLERICSKACPMEIGHEGNFHKHTQMFAEGLYRTGWLTGKKNPKHHRKGQKAHDMPLFPTEASLLMLFL